MALDNPTRDFLAKMAAAGGPQLHEMQPDQARALSNALGDLFGQGPDLKQVTDLRVPVGADSFPVRVYIPRAEPRGVLVYYHGGGWVIGELAGFDTLCRQLAKQTHCAVVLVEYRKAPEHRFPAAVDDAYAALTWVASNMREIVGREVPLLVGGDSAGGNLAAVTALRCRDRQGPTLAGQILVYPVTDCDLSTPSYLDPENQLFLARPTMHWFWDHYCPNQELRSHAAASPLRATSLVDLPPALVLTAEHDVLRDEGEAYAARLITSGVPTEFHRLAGQMHGFFTMVNVLPGAERGMLHVVDMIQRLVGK